MRALDPPFDVPYTVNNYDLVEFIGQGAFSHVYKGQYHNTLNYVAVKIIPKAHVRSSGDTNRLQREVDTMAFLKHSRIVSLVDFFEDAERYYLVMDYCEGGSIFDSLKRGRFLHGTTLAHFSVQLKQAWLTKDRRGDTLVISYPKLF